MSETVVLVDANNVRRSVWPNVTPERLVELCRAWASGSGRRVVVVFDRAAPGGVEGEHELDETATVVGSGRESADDWLVRRAAELAAAGTAYRLVTSDRAVREAAGPAAERTTGGGSFVRELLALP